jgi:hypothetical protein
VGQTQEQEQAQAQAQALLLLLLPLAALRWRRRAWESLATCDRIWLMRLAEVESRGCAVLMNCSFMAGGRTGADEEDLRPWL